MAHVSDVGGGLLHEQLVEAVGLGGGGGAQVVGAVAVLVVGQQGELGHHQHLAVNVLHRLVHLAVVVLKDAELDHLLEHPIQILLGVSRGDAQEDQQAVAAGADQLPVHVDGGGGNALNDCFHVGNSFTVTLGEWLTEILRLRAVRFAQDDRRRAPVTRSLWSRPGCS